MRSRLWLNELRFEARRLGAPGGRRLAASLVFLLSALSTWGGLDWRRYQQRVVGTVEAEDARLDRLFRSDAEKAVAAGRPVDLGSPLHPIAVYWKRVHAVEAPPSVSLLSVGQSDLLPYYAVFNGVEDQVLHFASEIQNPLHLALGRLDLAFWAAILLPLLLIALTYDLASEEREAGRLPLLALSALGLRQMFLVRLAFRLALVGALSLAGAAAAVFVAEGPERLRAGAPGLLAAAALGSLHLVFSAAAAFFVASRGWSSVRNVATLVGGWAVLSFVVPAALQTGAEIRFPTPSRNREALELVKAEERGDADRKAALERLLGERPDLSREASPPVPTAAVRIEWYPGFLAYQRDVSRKAAEREQAFRRALQAQEGLIDRWRLLSPPLALGRALGRLARSGAQDRFAFVANVEAFRALRREAMLERLFRNQVVPPADLDALPRFAPTRAPLDRGALAADAAWLVAASALLFAWAWRGFETG